MDRTSPGAKSNSSDDYLINDIKAVVRLKFSVEIYQNNSIQVI